MLYLKRKEKVMRKPTVKDFTEADGQIDFDGLYEALDTYEEEMYNTRQDEGVDKAPWEFNRGLNVTNGMLNDLKDAV